MTTAVAVEADRELACENFTCQSSGPIYEILLVESMLFPGKTFSFKREKYTNHPLSLKSRDWWVVFL